MQPYSTRESQQLDNEFHEFSESAALNSNSQAVAVAVGVGCSSLECCKWDGHVLKHVCAMVLSCNIVSRARSSASFNFPVPTVNDL
jgi:hypothetical protein